MSAKVRKGGATPAIVSQNTLVNSNSNETMSLVIPTLREGLTPQPQPLGGLSESYRKGESQEETKSKQHSGAALKIEPKKGKVMIQEKEIEEEEIDKNQMITIGVAKKSSLKGSAGVEQRETKRLSAIKSTSKSPLETFETKTVLKKQK